MRLIKNFGSLAVLTEVTKFIEENPHIAQWASLPRIKMVNDAIYLSGVKFNTEEDCVFYSLKFGLK